MQTITSNNPDILRKKAIDLANADGGKFIEYWLKEDTFLSIIVPENELWFYIYYEYKSGKKYSASISKKGTTNKSSFFGDYEHLLKCLKAISV